MSDPFSVSTFARPTWAVCIQCTGCDPYKNRVVQRHSLPNPTALDFELNSNFSTCASDFICVRFCRPFVSLVRALAATWLRDGLGSGFIGAVNHPPRVKCPSRRAKEGKMCFSGSTTDKKDISNLEASTACFEYFEKHSRRFSMKIYLILAAALTRQTPGLAGLKMPILDMGCKRSCTVLERLTRVLHVFRKVA